MAVKSCQVMMAESRLIIVVMLRIWSSLTFSPPPPPPPWRWTMFYTAWLGVLLFFSVLKMALYVQLHLDHWVFSVGVNFLDDELQPSADIRCGVNKHLMIRLSKLKWWWPSNDHRSSKFVSSPHVCMEWTCVACLMISGSNTPFRHEVRVNLIINCDSFTVMWRCTPIQPFSSNVVNPVNHPPVPISASRQLLMRVVTDVVLIYCFTCGTEL